MRTGHWRRSLLAFLYSTAVAFPVMALADGVKFDIVAEPLPSALKAFAEQAHMQLFYREDAVHNIVGNPVMGTMEKRAALEQLLRNTGLEAIYTSDTEVTIRPKSVGTDAASSAAKRAADQTRPNPGPFHLAQAEPASQGTDTTVVNKGEASGEASAEEPLGEVVVTGTLLRGIAPTGANLVNVSSQDITAIGATDTNQVLAKIPQIASSFNQVPALPSSDPGTSIVRPNLRNLGVAQGGTTTLVLLDGHRMVNAGILLTSVDPEVIAPGVIERIDVIPDGGSATYGSDAVGGVINLITRKRFDGFEVNARRGFGNDYHSFDMNMMLGKDWGSGSAYLSYAYLDHNQILGMNRDFVRQIQPQTGNCSPGTVQVARAGVTTNYALPGLAPNTMSSCDDTDYLGVYPSTQQNSVFGSFMQELSSSVQLNVRAFFSRREAFVSQDPNDPQTGLTESVTITPSNPYYTPIAPDPGQQTVLFSYQGVGKAGFDNVLQEYGVTPEITADLGHGWELRALGNYGHSIVTESGIFADPAAQAAALEGTTTQTALDPYNVTATNPGVLASIVRPTYSRGTQELWDGRVILDGSPFSLPGGEVRLAVGSEFMRESLDAFLVGNTNGTQNTHRNVYAVFGEAAFPIISAQNALPGVQSLTFSASGRHDHYSDFGSTSNPKLGFTYDPVSWVTLRGNWGTSFDAPSLADSGTATDTRAVLLSSAPFRDPNDPASNFNRPEIILAGGNATLKPQEAHTWSLGADIRPQAVRGFTVHGTYYNIDLTQAISIIPLFTPAAFIPAFSQYVVKNPTLAQSEALSAGVSRVDAGSCCSSLPALYALGTPYAILDARRHNLGELKQDGVDFSAAYTHDTGFGSVNANVGGTYILNRSQSPVAGQPFTDALASPGSSRLGLVASVGARMANLKGSVSLTHSSGYDLDPAIGTQTHVSAFDTVDLFLEYDLNGTGMIDKDLSFTLNVNNLFDKDPPFFNQNPGYTNGFTLGRLVELGVNKRF